MGKGRIFIRLIYRTLKKLRAPLLPLLHWNYSGGIGAAVFLTGFTALWTSNSYDFAAWCIAIGGVWLLGWWPASGHVLDQRPADSCASRQLWNAHPRREWIPVLIGAIVLVGLLRFAENSKLEYQRNNVRDGLSITYSIPPGFANNPNRSKIIIENKSGFDISGRHFVYCLVNREVDKPMPQWREWG